MSQPSANFLDVDWSQLPVPTDDGAIDHLKHPDGVQIPSISLPATNGKLIDLSDPTLGRAVVYVYPLTGTPGKALPDGWDDIPGARGCSPQSCSFRDASSALHALGVSHIFGLSTQPTSFQQDVVSRLHLPYPLLSDTNLAFAKGMQLPTFEVKEESVPLLKRMVLLLQEGKIVKVWYPVFPPDKSAELVLNHLKSV